MDPITIALIGAGLGLGKGVLDTKKEAKDRQMEAQIAQWSPWTGLAAQRPGRADVIGSTMQGGLTGAMMGQAMGKGGAAPATSGNLTDVPSTGAGLNYNGEDPALLDEKTNPFQYSPGRSSMSVFQRTV